MSFDCPDGNLLSVNEGDVLSIVIIGASGNLAKKKTYPACWQLFLSGLLPEPWHIFGYARSQYENRAFREKIGKFLKGGTEFQRSEFLNHLTYHRGQYDSVEDFATLNEAILEFENKKISLSENNDVSSNRLFYFAIPPSVFADSAAAIRASACAGERGWDRVVIEKPFGTDLLSAETLAKDIGQYFREEQIYRIDHYLGKEMVQNLFVLRFANSIWEPLWNRDHIDSVQIIFKEDLSVEGRGGYFDDAGILRDVMQNHLMQILSLVAMEPPVSFLGEDIRDEKVKVLRCIKPLTQKDVILGQYTESLDGEPKKPSYVQDETVPDNSRTPTFCMATIGVPFIVSCGKGLEERKAEIRIQFKDSPVPVFEHVNRNELVIRVQPNAGIFLKTNIKVPGMKPKVTTAELDLSYKAKYPNAPAPDAYERLLLDVFNGNHSQFVRRDELRASWEIFTPLLHEIDRNEHTLLYYPFGSIGPPETADNLKKLGIKPKLEGYWEGDTRDKLFGGLPKSSKLNLPDANEFNRTYSQEERFVSRDRA